MEYHKINTLFKREMKNKGRIIEGEWSCPEFDYLQNNNWVFTEKVDGMNIRIILSDTMTFGGRTDNASLPAQLVTRLNERFLPQEQKMREMFEEGCVLYGEGYGPKIQKGGGLYRADQDFVLFDARVGDWWLTRESVEKIAEYLGLDVVPIIGIGTLHDAIRMVKDGIKSTWGDFEAEGIVARPATELKTRAGHRLIAKIKCRDWRH
jgi:ATP-dependent RNA circularization protein (DNA/RNA ligase family)